MARHDTEAGFTVCRTTPQFLIVVVDHLARQQLTPFILNSVTQTRVSSCGWGFIVMGETTHPWVSSC
ncbi:hypothetical protein J6590_096587 [Homalodisca vitripennis]|nr:hypothetical protein J6590_072877 [Homalodisca vitripennis]KAG8314273.1 hypothetical protein J6590_096587 [Homalodisca vitripennis]